jgi:hypothetical protein
LRGLHMSLLSRHRTARTLGALAFLCLASATLAGCVTDQSAAAPAANAAPAAAIAAGQAIVTITRTDSFQAAGLSVEVTANGAKFASVDNGATFTGGINPGPVTLTVSHWSSPGQYTVRFNAEAGKRYAFQISPRSEQMLAGIAVGFAGVLADTAINGAEQSGTFKIVAVPAAR